MAILLKCEDMGMECDYLCADSEDELANRALQYAQLNPGWTEIPNEFRERVIALARPIDHC